MCGTENEVEKAATAAYLRRGRIFSAFSDEHLQALWMDSVRLASSEEGGGSAVRQMDDAAAEMRLRSRTALGDPSTESGTREVPQKSTTAADPTGMADLQKQIADFQALYRRPEE